ncbi:MAG: MoxR family ATPase [Burkholderiales bacterium]
MEAMPSGTGYVADRDVATAAFLSVKLGRPLLLEGEAGVGKTELAKALAAVLDRSLIRLQCYEGLDANGAMYEWNHARQLLEIRLAEAGGEAARSAIAADLYGERFLLKRPLLQALSGEPGAAPVLLIDELDRADEPFEACLLEILSDFQVTISELGTLRATAPPIVIITSNRTREIHDALKRRCLYHWVDYPSADRERAILERKVPALSAATAHAVVAFVQRLRSLALFKPPGIAEAIDWARALLVLTQGALDPEIVDATMGVLLKYREDFAVVRDAGIAALLADPAS